MAGGGEACAVGAVGCAEFGEGAVEVLVADEQQVERLRPQPGGEREDEDQAFGVGQCGFVAEGGVGVACAGGVSTSLDRSGGWERGGGGDAGVLVAVVPEIQAEAGLDSGVEPSEFGFESCGGGGGVGAGALHPGKDGGGARRGQGVGWDR